MKIGMALHVTKRNCCFSKSPYCRRAKVAITGCNPLSTQDDVAAALAKLGVNVYAWKGNLPKNIMKI